MRERCVAAAVAVVYAILATRKQNGRRRRRRSNGRAATRAFVFPSLTRTAGNRRRLKDIARRLESVGMRVIYDTPDPPPDIDVVVGKTSEELTFATLSGLKKLRYVLIPYAGPPRFVLTELSRLVRESKHSIRVLNSHHNSSATSEMAVALILAAAKNLFEGDRQLRSNNWLGRGLYPARFGEAPQPGISQMWLREETALIVGYGSVGSKVGAVLRSIGMTVVGTRRSLHTPETLSDPRITLYPSTCFRRLIRELRPRVLVLCVPGTSETDGLVGSAELDALPRNAVLVNVARGPVIDEDALYNHLREHPNFTAAIDCWYSYPNVGAGDDAGDHAPSRRPFASLRNVIMSPHRAGAMGNEAVENERFVGIEKVLWALANPTRDSPLPRPMSLEMGY